MDSGHNIRVSDQGSSRFLSFAIRTYTAEVECQLHTNGKRKLDPTICNTVNIARETVKKKKNTSNNK